MRADAFTLRPLAVPRGHRQLRLGRASTWRSADICGRAVRPAALAPARRAAQRTATYFYYLARGDDDEPRAQVADGLAAGYEVFYLKVGLDDAEDVAHGRGACARRSAPGPRLRLDANGSWSRAAGAAHAASGSPSTTSTSSSSPCATTRSASSASCARRSPIAVCANEGLWSEADAYARIRAREADVYCFSPYWVGSLGGVPAARARRRARGPAGLQAHPRRARHRRRRRPARRC